MAKYVATARAGEEQNAAVPNDTASMIKTIVAKWQAGANRSWDGNYPEPPSLA